MCNGVLPSAPKGSFATLLSPLQCHASFDMMPHTLASVDHSSVCHPGTLPPSATRQLRVGFGGGRRLNWDLRFSCSGCVNCGHLGFWDIVFMYMVPLNSPNSPKMLVPHTRVHCITVLLQNVSIHLQGYTKSIQPIWQIRNQLLCFLFLFCFS
jgi:hypothetical protein